MNSLEHKLKTELANNVQHLIDKYFPFLLLKKFNRKISKKNFCAIFLIKMELTLTCLNSFRRNIGNSDIVFII